MKKISTSAACLLLLSLFISACGDMTVKTGDGSQKIEGNGKLTSENRDVTAFTAIDLGGVFNVTLIQGEKEAVKIETDENIQPLVLVSVEHDTLKLRLKEDISINKMKKINVSITFVDITALRSAGVGELKSASMLRLKSFDLHCEGVGATNLAITADYLKVRSDVVGALVLAGNAKEASIDHDGVGLVQAFGLITEKMTLHANGVGAAEVFASSELSINASGIGNVKYKGGATKKDIKANGLGKVEQVD